MSFKLIYPGEFPQAFCTTDFSEYEVGVSPSDWRRLYGSATTFKIITDADMPGTRAMQLDSFSATEAITWNRLGVAADWDVLSLIHIPTPMPDTPVKFSGVRMQPGNQNGYFLAIYLEPDNPGQSLALIFCVVGGVVTSVGQMNHSYAAGDLLWGRLRAHGQRISAKIWNNADPEPEDWSFAGNDTNFADGLCGWRVNQTIQRQGLGFFSACTGGGIAPGPAA